MAWMDDFQTRIEQEADKAFSDIGDYVRSRAVEPVVRIGQEQLGNLSQAQIDAGKAGAPKPLVSSQMVSQATDTLKSLLPWIAVGALVYFAVNTKKSRG